MDVNVYTILEKIREIPKKKILGTNILKSLEYRDAEMSIEEFDESIKYIQKRELLKVIPIHENEKIRMIIILDE